MKVLTSQFVSLFVNFWQDTTYSKKAMGILLICIAQLTFLLLISYTGDQNHIFGRFGYEVANLLITKFMGLSAFAIPVSILYLGYAWFLKRQNGGEIVRIMSVLFLWFFSFNLLLLNTFVVETRWAGLFPRFFHAIIYHTFEGQMGELNLGAMGMELVLMVIASFLVIKNYFHLTLRDLSAYVIKTHYALLAVGKRLKKRNLFSSFSGLSFGLVSRVGRGSEKSTNSAKSSILGTSKGKEMVKRESPAKRIREMLKISEDIVQTIDWQEINPKHQRILSDHLMVELDGQPIKNDEKNGKPVEKQKCGEQEQNKAQDYSSGYEMTEKADDHETTTPEFFTSEIIDLEIIDLSRDQAKQLFRDRKSELREATGVVDFRTGLSEILESTQIPQGMEPTSPPIGFAEGTTEGSAEKTSQQLPEETLRKPFRKPLEEIVEDVVEDVFEEEGEKQFEDVTEFKKSNKKPIVLPSIINYHGENEEKENWMADPRTLIFSSHKKHPESQEDIEQTGKKLEETILQFGIRTQVVGISVGPVITQFELMLEPGVKINKILSLSDNLALALAAETIRIVAPIPGRKVIGIEVPNKQRDMVALRDIVSQQEFIESHNRLPIALGSSISGQPMVADLAQTPHLLVAGATGSGKSVCVNSIILSLLLKKSPQEVRLLMIDPKMVELNIYNGIPHLLAPVITDHKKASWLLKWAISEMEARYRVLERFGVRNIVNYNELIKKEGWPEKYADDPKPTTLPYIVIIIDEFADLMMVARKEIEDSVSRLAAMSRAVGIHLILATQRPSVDVITGVIKANFPSRIAFQVSSKVDSRTIIDAMGAEKLLGRGDMLYQNVSAGAPQRIQGAFLSDQEVRDVVEDLKVKAKNRENYLSQLLHGEASDVNHMEEEEDGLFNEAVEVARQDRKVSASYLQRRLKVGYNRAARIVEMMEERGIIGEADGSKPREVLI